MPIEMPRGLPFSVDTWSTAASRKRYHFLTHAHRDHLTGISSRSYPIYSTRITRNLVLNYFPQLHDSLFVEIEVGEAVVIDDQDGAFSVTALDANHCLGAVMFLFEGEFGNILHTGDCRLTPDCLRNLPLKYIVKKGRDTLCHLDYLFLDCTFGRCSVKIPSKESAIQQVINCIWKHPNSPVVYLACDMLGQEEILLQVSKTFGSKIYVDKTNHPECFHALSLSAPGILSQDASSRFQLVEGFPRLNERASQKLAEARANLEPGPLFIRPSAQWYAGNDNLGMAQREKPGVEAAVRDEFGVWHVCYSMHSSRDELEWALQLIQPKWVISTTPPCRAMELDYVKNNCYKTHMTSDDPIWKLLKLPTGKSALLPSPTTSDVLRNISATSVVEVSAPSADSNKLELKELSVNHIELKLNLPQASIAGPITLFGRARHGLQDAALYHEEKESKLVIAKNEAGLSLREETVAEKVVITVAEKVVIAELSVEKSEEVDVEGDMLSIESSTSGGRAELIVENSGEESDVKREMTAGSTRIFDSVEATAEIEEVGVKREISSIPSSISFNASLRKMYRSMNVPVPRPLPSLVELMDDTKRVKHGCESCYDRLKLLL